MRAGRLLSFAVLVAIACATPSRVRAASQDAGVTWLIFVDDLHLDFLNTGYIRKLLGSIASELIRDGDAFVLRSSGPSPSIPFTTNRSLLDTAISSRRTPNRIARMGIHFVERGPVITKIRAATGYFGLSRKPLLSNSAMRLES